jgi:glycosyltransferase involved in cell wall biosynthesis
MPAPLVLNDAAVERRRRRVCIDCRYIGPRPSGIGEVVQALVDHLPALAPDLDFLLLKHPAAGRLSDQPNVREVVVRQAANGPTTMWWLPIAVDLSGVDLFHATYNIMPAGLPMPCVTTIHDMMWLTDYRLCNDSLKGQVERHFFGHGIRRALRSAAAIATVSAATRDEIARIAPAAARRSAVTLSGVSADFAPGPRGPDAAAAGADPCPPPGRRFVLTVGQYSPYKNHEGALAGFARAFADRPEIDLVFVQRRGDGQRRLTEAARRLGIEGRVHFPRNISREQLVALYRSAEALLHPSFCEGFGNPLAEAMACGCPVVTSAVSAMPEVTGDAAVLVDPSNPASIAAGLIRVVDDASLASVLSGRGLARAANLSWQTFAAENLAIYRQVLGRT